MGFARLLSSVCGLMLFVALVGCSKKSDATLSVAERYGFDVISVDNRHPLCGDGSPCCHVAVDLLYNAGDDSVAVAMNRVITAMVFDDSAAPAEAVRCFVEEKNGNYVRELAALYAEDTAKNRVTEGWYNYYYLIETSLDEGRAGVLCYTLEKEVYEGGIHGLNTTTYVNIDPTTGERIRLADFFGWGHEARLKVILYDKLMGAFGANSMEELYEMSFLGYTELYPTENFRLGADCVTFCYNPYEIAPYDCGKIMLKVDYSELEGLIRKN